MKRLLFILCATLFFYACGNKYDNTVETLDESFVLIKEYIEDFTISFEDYQPIFEEILDSLQEVVLNLNNRQLFTCEWTGV